MPNQTKAQKKQREPESPYSKAKMIWDDRIGSSVKRAANWRLAAFMGWILSILLAIIVGLLINKSSVEPFIVQVDSKTGKVLNVGNIKESYVPKLQEYKYFISEFIKNVRSVSSDRIIIQENWKTAYKFLTIRGNNQLTEYAKENDPFALAGKVTVAVKIETVNKITDRSYQVNWVETIYNYSGGSAKKEYSGILTVVSLPPNKKSDLINNPLGIYIDEISWSERK